MSRYYRMQFRIEEYNEHNYDDIISALQKSWGIDDHYPINENNKEIIIAEGEDSLYGGQTEEEFSRDIAKDIWIANKGYCKVQVIATYLEDIPSETHDVDHQSYLDLLNSNDKDFIRAVKGKNTKCEFCFADKENTEEKCKICGSIPRN